MKRSILVLTALLATFSSCAIRADTTFIFVRHAEKQADESRVTEPLSEEGHLRASELARVLKDVPVDAVYASTKHTEDGDSPYIRSWDTVRPLAGEHTLTIVGYVAGDIEGVLERALKDHRDGVVVIVGHSNTVPLMLGSLGIEIHPKLEDDAYDDLFVVTVDELENARI